jgi:hypothetical protein
VTWNREMQRMSAGRGVPGLAHGRKLGLAIALTALAIFSGAVIARRAPRARAMELLKVDVEVVARGYRASTLIGASVTNDKNEDIGAIDDIVIDKKRALYAILQVGGFLGVGGRLIAIPYEQLMIDDAGKKITLPGATREELGKLNEFKYWTAEASG